MKNRPTSVPMGAEWLNQMPAGNGWIPPISTQPIKEIHFKECKKGTQVVEWLYAEVKQQNLGRGTATNDKIRKWVKQVGRPNDDAGHIIGNNQGGLGTVEWNIFPQNSNFNRGVFARDVEKLINDAANKGTVKIWFRFIFGKASEPCRPSSFRYFIQLGNGTVINNDLLNP